MMLSKSVNTVTDKRGRNSFQKFGTILKIGLKTEPCLQRAGKKTAHIE